MRDACEPLTVPLPLCAGLLPHSRSQQMERTNLATHRLSRWPLSQSARGCFACRTTVGVVDAHTDETYAQTSGGLTDHRSNCALWLVTPSRHATIQRDETRRASNSTDTATPQLHSKDQLHTVQPQPQSCIPLAAASFFAVGPTCRVALVAVAGSMLHTPPAWLADAMANSGGVSEEKSHLPLASSPLRARGRPTAAAAAESASPLPTAASLDLSANDEVGTNSKQHERAVDESHVIVLTLSPLALCSALDCSFTLPSCTTCTTPAASCLPLSSPIVARGRVPIARWFLARPTAQSTWAWTFLPAFQAEPPPLADPRLQSDSSRIRWGTLGGRLRRSRR